MPAKRKYQTPNKDPPFTSDSPYSKRSRRSVANQSDLAQAIFDVIKDHEDEDGRAIADNFMKLPSKRYHPEYHEQIVDPVDLTKIGQRIRMDEYRDIEILTTDIQLMTSNAKKYYNEDTEEYADACKLWELYLNTKSRLVDQLKPTEEAKSRPGRKPRNRAKTADDSDFEEIDITQEEMKSLYEATVSETDDEGRLIAEMFMQLPDKTNIEYYALIKDPIDFLIIGDRVEDGYYKSVLEFEKDLNLLVKNAKAFNDPNSQIYEDAVTLRSLFKEKMNEMEKSKHPELMGTKSSARLKHRKSWGRASERIHERNIKQEQEDKHELHEVSIINCHEDDYQGLFYNEIVNYRNNIGHTIADPFCRLPNKRFYPTYYEEIDNPISLKMIRKKLQAKKYDSCHELAKDFELLFSNAMKFNVANSLIHKDAVTLKSFMETKVQEYATKEEENTDESSESEEEEEDKIKKETPKHDTSASEKGEVSTKKRKRRKKRGETLHGRMRLLYETVLDAETDDGREMILLFLEKPSRKDYPDYYKLVVDPIDMRMIEKKIRQEKYGGIQYLLDDFHLMFNNARQYNEPGSQVYLDADTLEKLLLDKNKELGPLSEQALTTTPGRSTFSKKQLTPLEENMEKLFVKLRDFTDPTGRAICEIFSHLPTKQELPDYYKVIKKPMEMDRIQQKMQGGQYTKLEEMLSDMLLMFENACVYNEPGSVIYKDALILQKLGVKTFYKLEGIEPLPRSQQLVHEMLTNLFMSLMNHQDNTGRCYSDSLSGMEVKNNSQSSTQDAMDTSEPPQHPGETLSLGVIKKNLHHRRYKRLDVFQEQVFDVLEEARERNRTDSEIYEDAVELQKFFIKIRDELCKNGEILVSPALSYTTKRLENDLDVEKKEKVPEEPQEDEVKDAVKFIKDELKESAQTDEGVVYKVGDFVYVENPDKRDEKHVVCIEKFYLDDAGEQRMYGSWFLAPHDTDHTAGKRFLQQEVFKSDYYNTVPVKNILGRCFVMMMKDYFNLKPKGFNNEDIYVCESRYMSQTKSFRRIKALQVPVNDTSLVPRETPLPMIRVSTTGDATQEPALEVGSSWPTDVIDKERENIKTEIQNPHSEATYYIQYYAQGMWVKLGDCLYVRNSGGAKPKIARVERLWTDMSGNVWFHGPWFVRPESTEHEPTRMFFKNELFLSSVEDTVLMSDVTGKCMVLCGRDYTACRPTEMPEDDVYVYESKYFDKIIKKIKGIKRYMPTHKVVDDEYYYFKKPFTPENVLSPSLIQLVQEDMKQREQIAKQQKEQKFAVNEPIPGSGYVNPHQPSSQPYHQQAVYGQPQMIVQPAYHTYPQQFAQGAIDGAARPYLQQQQYQGYPSPHPGVVNYQNSPHMVYSSSPHTAMITPNPGVQSPDSSRPSSVRPESVATPPPKKKGRGGHSTGYILFASHCHPKVRADNPDLPFGDISKLVGEEWRNLDEDEKHEYEERAREKTARAEAEGRLTSRKKKKKKDDEVVTPTTTIPPGLPYQQTPQYTLIQQRPQLNADGTPQHGYTPGMGPYTQTPTGIVYPPQPIGTVKTTTPASIAERHRVKRGPLFLQPPPKAQRVMHSEAYLRYIEGLEKGSKTLSNWNRTLKVRERDVLLTKEEEEKLPVHWLANGKARYETTKSALWALRDLMLKDAFAIKNSF
ncbi:protein polybromo-1 isoform X1 [Ciona intestinalis]